MLSAGGSWGAWGAGVLYGWGQTGLRPQFDLVTGASTGALLATFALLGTMDNQMKTAYTTTTNAQVFKRRSIFTIGFSNSVNTLEPLRATLQALFTPAVVGQVAAEYINHGRQIWVATTDLDTGQLCNWNLSQVAASGNYNKYIDLLIASSANPGLFDVQEIDGTLQADGGVRNQLFTGLVKEGADAYAALTAPPANPTAYVIVNGQLLVRRQCVPNQIVFVMTRASSILQNTALRGDLETVENVLENHPLPWTFKASYVPDDYPLWPTPDVFKPAQMADLFEQGRLAGNNLSHWKTSLPPWDQNASPAPCIPPF